MKKKSIVFIISIGFTLISCNKDFVIDNGEGLENTRDRILEAFGQEKEVSILRIETLSNEMIAPSLFRVALIEYVDDGEIYNQYLYSSEKEAMEPQNNLKSEEFQKTKEVLLSQMKGHVKLNSFNFNQIPIKVEAAKKMLEKGYTYQSISFWEFNVSNNNKIKSSFRLRCSYKNKPAEYLVSFEVDENGILKKNNF